MYRLRLQCHYEQCIVLYCCNHNRSCNAVNNNVHTLHIQSSTQLRSVNTSINCNQTYRSTINLIQWLSHIATVAYTYDFKVAHLNFCLFLCANTLYVKNQLIYVSCVCVCHRLYDFTHCIYCEHWNISSSIDCLCRLWHWHFLC
jgi:hypothetical protein